MYVRNGNEDSTFQQLDVTERLLVIVEYSILHCKQINLAYNCVLRTAYLCNYEQSDIAIGKVDRRVGMLVSFSSRDLSCHRPNMEPRRRGEEYQLTKR